ncbi:hypothetical protein [Azospirillum sp. B510]|uniref:hypothetical protein n=1 Tax=Azospirillum sp. (strain B510) TaxID=137722 RepID=UPI0005A9A116|nr:hypothetical protein [Azospirillum sp. B510]
MLTDEQKAAIAAVLAAWESDDEDGCGCWYGLDYLDYWLAVDGCVELLHALDGERDALPEAVSYIEHLLSAEEAAAALEWPRFMDVARDVAAGRMTLSEALGQHWSIRQRCVLALVAREPRAAPKAYAEPKAAWARLNGEQQAFVRNLLGTAMLREMGVEVVDPADEEEEREELGGLRP